MLKLLEFMYVLVEVLKLIKDSDGDGRIDILDDDPNNPDIK